jgi:hypothetical protein
VLTYIVSEVIRTRGRCKSIGESCGFHTAFQASTAGRLEGGHGTTNTRWPCIGNTKTSPPGKCLELKTIRCEGVYVPPLAQPEYELFRFRRGNLSTQHRRLSRDGPEGLETHCYRVPTWYAVRRLHTQTNPADYQRRHPIPGLLSGPADLMSTAHLGV